MLDPDYYMTYNSERSTPTAGLEQQRRAHSVAPYEARGVVGGGAERKPLRAISQRSVFTYPVVN